MIVRLRWSVMIPTTTENKSATFLYVFTKLHYIAKYSENKQEKFSEHLPGFCLPLHQSNQSRDSSYCLPFVFPSFFQRKLFALHPQATLICFFSKLHFMYCERKWFISSWQHLVRHTHTCTRTCKPQKLISFRFDWGSQSLLTCVIS